MAAYNIAFAFFQPIAIGVFDQFLTSRMLLKYPNLYHNGQTNAFYNATSFWAWIGNSFFHSLFIYYCFSALYGEGQMLGNGDIANQWVLGQMVYTAELITITVKAALVIDTFVNFTAFALLGSIAFWFIGLPVYAIIGPQVGVGNELLGLNSPLFGSPSFWLGIFIIPLAANLRDFIWRLYSYFLTLALVG